MYETAGTEPRHTNGNPAMTINVGAGKPEDPKNEGDRVTPYYVYRSGRRDKVPRHQVIERQCRYQGEKSRSAGTHMSRRAVSPHKNRYPATHSTNEEEHTERKKKYESQCIRKNKKIRKPQPEKVGQATQ